MGGARNLKFGGNVGARAGHGVQVVGGIKLVSGNFFLIPPVFAYMRGT